MIKSSLGKLHLLIIVFVQVFFAKGLLAEDAYTYQVSVCAIFRDDARFLKEWIEFHRLIGVEHFWLYNNLSKDDYLEVLNPYIENGIVELTEWPYESMDVKEWEEVQNSAYDDSIKKAAGKSKWVAYIDTDEFLFPSTEEQLTEVLKDFEDFGGVVVNWQLYGTSWVKRVPDNRLMIELLTRKAETDYERNRLYKSIVRPERARKFSSAHSPEYFKQYLRVDTHQNKVSSRFLTKEVLVDRLRINHYWTRDEDFFIEIKMARRDKPNSDYQRYLDAFDLLNECEDTSIFKYIDILRSNMDFQ